MHPEAKAIAREQPLDLLARLTERAAETVPKQIALIHDADRLTYEELHERSLRCVAWLRGRGIGVGGRIGYLGLNSIDYVVLMQAALRIGAVLVAVNWRLAPPEIAFVLRDSGITLLVSETERLDVLGASGVDVPTWLVDGDPSWRETLAACDPDEEVADLSPELVALQLYTSGTTGHPKGALLTHGSLRASLRQGTMAGEDWARWDADDVSLVAMPQFHIGGTAWTLQGLNGRSTMVLLSQPDTGALIEAVEAHGVTKMFAVPAVLNMILGHPAAAGRTFPSLRELLYGASPIPIDVLTRTMAKFPKAQFVQMYGSTETSGTVVYLPPQDHDPAGTPRMAGCGRPFPEVALRVVGDDGEDRAVGQVGEVLVRAPLLMAGYHNRPDDTRAAFCGDWYRTGDAGRLDDDGYLYLLDRLHDMIVSGAENIYPTEVENALSDHPAVADVAVIGVPDERWGEAVKALVVLVPGGSADEAGLIAHARDRIAGYKLPKSVDFVPDLPRNPSGKVLKRALRERHWPAGDRRIN